MKTRQKMVIDLKDWNYMIRNFVSGEEGYLINTTLKDINKIWNLNTEA